MSVQPPSAQQQCINISTAHRTLHILDAPVIQTSEPLRSLWSHDMSHGWCNPATVLCTAMQQASALADGRARAASCHARTGAAAGRHEGALLLQGAGPWQRLQRGRAAARHPQRSGLPGPPRARARARRAAAVRAGCLASACRGSAMRSSGGADVCARAGARWPACPVGHAGSWTGGCSARQRIPQGAMLASCSHARQALQPACMSAGPKAPSPRVQRPQHASLAPKGAARHVHERVAPGSAVSQGTCGCGCCGAAA